ncbi:pyridoxamine 5'-phosphate oxidase family protein [Streptomyces sp. NPDC051909]|uniref:pyridoxamine 5'-phosphate oxidase family protein n=1 Tax=Streptomyces sp. NPDC051909 TaxID=3154944 RepID=UPI00342C15DD
MTTEATRRTAEDRRAAAAPRRMAPLPRAEALRLLGTVSLGRIIFTQHALPTARPVNHLMDGEDIVVRLHDGATLMSLLAPAAAPAVVVAYEADVIDPDTHIGWSVVVTGYAHRVTDDAELGRLAARLRPWVEHPVMNAAVRIRADLVTGMRLTAAEPPDRA